ncbi:MAG: PAS domain S-box protein, partial [Desulfobacteraceae bacterium]|nr:PAS domain S-box protein [Desulfobacteraceae bacterium]
MAEEIYVNPVERTTFLQSLQKNGYITDFEAQLKHKDGTIWWASTNAHFQKDKDGNIIGVEGVTRDITERKQAEEALLKNEEELQAIVDHSVDAIGVSQQGIHRLVNPAYLKMFGYQNAKDLIGKPIFELISPDERKRIKQFVADRIKGRSVNSHYQTRGLKKDG